jgi:XrtJ-associated TM-motif-TM protein
MNRKKTAFVLGLVLTLFLSLPLRAQSGCVDSPEDSTLVLALVGGAGAFQFTAPMGVPVVDAPPPV